MRLCRGSRRPALFFLFLLPFSCSFACSLLLAVALGRRAAFSLLSPRCWLLVVAGRLVVSFVGFAPAAAAAAAAASFVLSFVCFSFAWCGCVCVSMCVSEPSV